MAKNFLTIKKTTTKKIQQTKNNKKENEVKLLTPAPFLF